MANRISKSRRNKVLLLEAGGNPNDYTNIPGIRAVEDNPLTFYAYKTEFQPNVCNDTQHVTYENPKFYLNL